MKNSEEKTVTIVNKNYPPNSGITGYSANELANYLVKVKGFRVIVVHTDAVYGNKGEDVQPAGERIAVKGLYNGKNKIIRLIASFLESYTLVSTAKKKGKGLIIIMTDPPFLVFWSALLLKKHLWAYWSMDLYPDAFKAGTLVKEQNFFYRKFREIVIKNPPSFLLTLGEMQRNYLLHFYDRNIPSVTLPCGILPVREWRNEKVIPAWYKPDGKIYLGYCGNLGEAHSKEFLLKMFDLLDASKHKLILSLYGSRASEVLEYAAGNPAIEIQKHVPQEHLQWIDIHLVTLMPHWNHICVPSKAFSAITAGGTILFCGTRDNDIWFYLQEAGWLIDEEADKNTQLRNLFSHLDLQELAVKKANAIGLAMHMNSEKTRAFEEIALFSSN